jgi:hypothetical protein
METRKEKIIQEILELKTTKNITLDSKKKIQKLQQELDEIDHEKKDTKNL